MKDVRKNSYDKYYYTTDNLEKVIEWSKIFMQYKILWRIEQFHSVDQNDEFDIHVVVKCGPLDIITIYDLTRIIGEKIVYLYFEHS